MSDQIPDEDAEQIQAAIFSGNKIQAIKHYRKLSGKDLKQAKDFIEALTVELRRSSPEKFAPAGKGCGTAALCLLIVLSAAATLALYS